MSEVEHVVVEGTLPERRHSGDAGFDCRARVDGQVTIVPGARVKVPLGFRMELPAGKVGLLFARSGLAAEDGIEMANGVGVVDSGYRGEVCALLHNISRKPFVVSNGDRVCQLVVMDFPDVRMVAGAVHEDRERGTGGFGSTGTK